MGSHQDHGQEQAYQYGDNAYSSYMQEHVDNQYCENDYSRYRQEHVYNQYGDNAYSSYMQEHVDNQYCENDYSRYRQEHVYNQSSENHYSSYMKEHVYNQYGDYPRYGQEQPVYNQFSESAYSGYGQEHVYRQYGESASSSYPYGHAPMQGNEKPKADFWDNIPSDRLDLMALLEFMKELYMKNQELFKKVFPKFAEKHSMKGFAKGKYFHGLKPKTMARSLSLGSPRGGDSIPKLERFKLRPPVLVVTGGLSENNENVSRFR